MGFHNRITLHLDRAVREAIKDDNATLKERLFAVLQKLLETQNDGLVDNDIRDISKEVVYLVLSANDFTTGKRAFVVGLNMDNLNNEVVNDQLLDEDVKKNFQANEITSDTLAFSVTNQKISDKQKESIHKTWNVVWHDYYQITNKGDIRQDKLLTLNQWLLKYLNNPLNIGVYWGEMSLDAEESYHYLSESTLHKLGIQLLASGSADIKNMRPDLIISTVSDATFDVMAQDFNEMGQIDESLDLAKNVRFCIYHLLRSYGCWGGRAFYSIPISYGLELNPNVGVLSICTSKPMNEQLVLKWSLIANKIFKDVIFQYIKRLTKLESQLAALKTTSMSTHVIKTEVKKLISEIQKITNKDIRGMLSRLESDANNLFVLTGIFNLLNKVDDAKKFEKTGKNDQLLTGLILDWEIEERVSDYNADLKRRAGKEIVVNYLNAQSSFPNFKVGQVYFDKPLINCFIRTILENIETHGLVENNRIHLTIFNQGNTWQFSNKAVEKFEVSDKLTGNLHLFKHLIEKTDSGQLEFKPVSEHQHPTFELTLRLANE